MIASSVSWAQQDPEQAFQEARLLITLDKLQLSNEQRQRMLQTANALNLLREELVAARAQAWEEQQANIEAVLAAWARGEAAPRDEQRAADKAVAQIKEMERKLAESENEFAEMVANDLTADQRQWLETKEHARQRLDRLARLGTETIGEYLAHEIEQMRDLMPDEYSPLRVGETQRMAVSILGPQDRGVQNLAGRILEIMDKIMSWAPDNFEQQRPTLAAQISQYLGLQEGKLPEEMVKYDEVLELVRSELTADLLADLLQAGGGGGQG